MPRILLDGSHLRRRSHTGIAGYARTLAGLLHQLGADIALLLDSRARPTKGLPPVAYASQVFGNTAPHRIGRWLGPIEIFASTKVGFATHLKAYQVAEDTVDAESLDPPLPPHDAVYNASNFFEHAQSVFAISGRVTQIDAGSSMQAVHWTAAAPVTAKGMPNIYTIHDVIPLRFPHFTVDRGGRSARMHATIAARADHIITVSESSRADIARLLEVPADRISVTYQPVPPLAAVPTPNAERLATEIYGVRPGEFALFCGALEPKKNIARLIEAFTIANTGFPLLIAGPEGWLFDDVIRLLNDLQNNRAADSPALARYIGFLPRRHMTALMQTARFFAFPSLYEGFGLPVLEAMSLGVPVLTSTGGSLPEISGDAAVLVDPLNIDAMAEGIRTLASDSDLRAELSRRGPVQAAKFSVERCSDLLRQAYGRAGVSL